jgi:hypothetical protein
MLIVTKACHCVAISYLEINGSLNLTQDENTENLDWKIKIPDCHIKESREFK